MRGYVFRYAVTYPWPIALRLTMQADLEPRLPLDRSGIMVEYGPVPLGGGLSFAAVAELEYNID
jgi:hypothetical protein